MNAAAAADVVGELGGLLVPASGSSAAAALKLAYGEK